MPVEKGTSTAKSESKYPRLYPELKGKNLERAVKWFPSCEVVEGKKGNKRLKFGNEEIGEHTAREGCLAILVDVMQTMTFQQYNAVFGLLLQGKGVTIPGTDENAETHTVNRDGSVS